MAFEKQQAFFVQNKRNVASDQFESTARIEVQPEKPVKRVLTVKAMAKITTKEKLADDVKFSGKTTYQIAYQTEDNTLCSALAVVEWNGKLENVKEENVFLTANVMANTITGFSGTEIAISSLVNVDAFGIFKEEVQSVENLSEDFVKLEKTYEYENVVSFASDSFNEVAELEVPAIVSDVLYSDGTVEVANVICGIDTVTIEGTVHANGTFVQEGKVVPFAKDIDFKRELSALSTVPNNIADADVYLENLMVTASVNETDQKTNLVFSVELSVCTAVYSKEMAVLVQDAFSTLKEVENTYECVTATNFEKSENYKESITATIQTPENAVELGYVFKANAEITDKIQTDNGTLLNGAIMVEAVLLDENANAEMFKNFAPFSILVPDATENDEYAIKTVVTNATLKANTLEIALDALVNYKENSKEYIGFVKSIEEKEEKVKSNSAIRVYVTKEGEDLFAVAKAISMKPEDILMQNPGVTENLENGTRLVVYSGLNLNF